jgi:hypothetical protein
MKIFFILFFTLLTFNRLDSLEFNKVVFWGHKLHTHTHSYIQAAFKKGFDYLGYETYWFDDQDEILDFDFSNSLFFTIYEHDKKVPLRDDCYYVYHHCWCKEHRCANEKYGQMVREGRAICLKCFWKEYLEPDSDYQQIDTYIYKSPKNRELIFPWATDLLPHEIDNMKQKIAQMDIKNRTIFIGTITDSGFSANFKQIQPFLIAAKKRKIASLTMDPWTNPISNEECMELIQESLLAPALQGKWQVENGYIPCRIFKNISYGKMDITNSEYVYNLFEKQIVFNKDSKKLLRDSLDELERHTLEKQFALMDFVKENHTYLNRINNILDLFEEIKTND